MNSRERVQGKWKVQVYKDEVEGREVLLTAFLFSSSKVHRTVE